MEMLHSNLVAAHGIVNKRPDRADKKAEAEFYAGYGSHGPLLGVPSVPLARLRFALGAFRRAFASYDMAQSN